MSDLQNKVIQIASKEEKAGPFGPMVKIKDQDGKTYTVFKNKKDGTTSVAWEQMPAVGDTVQIGYAEEDKEFEGKPFKQRTARSFNSDIGQGTVNAQSTRTEPPVSSQGARNWDKEAYEKCCSIWSASEMAKGIAITQIIQEHIGDGWYYKLFQAIKTDGDERFSTPSSWDKLGAKLKSKVEIADDISDMAEEMAKEVAEVEAEGIPF